MRILILHTLPPRFLGEDRTVHEFDLSGPAMFVAKSLRGSMVRAVRGWPGEIMDVLSQTRPDVVFNLCEAPLGRPDLEAHIASFLEWAGVRFTGCGSETLALCRRKDLTGAVLRARGIAVPAEFDPANAGFPCVVKPAAEDGSAGIHDHSLCHDAEQLRFALSQLDMPLLVQEFIPGREFGVNLWGRSDPDHFAIAETTREGRLITYEMKWDRRPPEGGGSADAPIDAILQEQLVCTARAVWKAVGARHLMRIEIRLDRKGTPCVLDVNPNPGISPNADICLAVRQAGWRYEDFFRKLVEWA